MKGMFKFAALALLVGSVSACSIPGLGPDYAESRAFNRSLDEARDPPPTQEECAYARELNANRVVMRQTDREYVDGVLGRCPGGTANLGTSAGIRGN